MALGGDPEQLHQFLELVLYFGIAVDGDAQNAIVVIQQATGDIPALQAVLGHKTISMTMRYAHLATEHLHDVFRKAGTKLGTRATVSAKVGSAEALIDQTERLIEQPDHAR